MSLDDNPGPPMPPAGIVCIVLGVLLLVCGVCLMETGRRRFLGRCVLPFVGRSLAPLKPTREEIESTLHALAARGWAIGTLLTTSDVFAAVRTARPPTTWADTGPQGLAPRRPS